MKNMETKAMKTFHFLSPGLWPFSLIFARRFAFPLLVLNAGLVVVQPCAGAPFQFEETGSLITPHAQHTATLLSNGKVLVAGGVFGSPLASAELYDPANGTWTATGSLAHARFDHTATLLRNGKVLVVGGYDVPIAELYDPTSGTWTATGRLTTGRQNHSDVTRQWQSSCGRRL